MTRLLGLCCALVAFSLLSPGMVPVVAYDGGTGEAPSVRAKDGGSIDGEVVSVDYRTGHFGVKVGPTIYDVVVLPSTDFEGRDNDFRGFTDIKKGAHVNVLLSLRATTYVAQIIHLR